MPPLAALALAVRDRLLAGADAPLPGLGTLARTHVSARLRATPDGGRVMLPPGEIVTLLDRTSDPTDLAQALARHAGAAPEAAAGALRDAVDQLDARLAITGDAQLPGVGVFQRTSSGIRFAPAPEIQSAVNRAYEGLTPVPVAAAAPPAPAPPPAPPPPAPPAEPPGAVDILLDLIVNEPSEAERAARAPEPSASTPAQSAFSDHAEPAAGPAAELGAAASVLPSEAAAPTVAASAVAAAGAAAAFAGSSDAGTRDASDAAAPAGPTQDDTPGIASAPHPEAASPPEAEMPDDAPEPSDTAEAEASVPVWAPDDHDASDIATVDDASSDALHDSASDVARQADAADLDAPSGWRDRPPSADWHPAPLADLDGAAQPLDRTDDIEDAEVLDTGAAAPGDAPDETPDLALAAVDASVAAGAEPTFAAAPPEATPLDVPAVGLADIYPADATDDDEARAEASSGWAGWLLYTLAVVGLAALVGFWALTEPHVPRLPARTAAPAVAPAVSPDTLRADSLALLPQDSSATRPDPTAAP